MAMLGNGTDKERLGYALGRIEQLGRVIDKLTDLCSSARAERLDAESQLCTFRTMVDTRDAEIARLTAERDEAIERYRLAHIDWANEAAQTLQLIAEVRALRKKVDVTCGYLSDRVELRWDDELIRVVTEWRDASMSAIGEGGRDGD